MKVQVAIIGSGPAGLLLGQLLHGLGISTVIIERQTRAHVEVRIRAGVLESGTVDLLERAGVASRLHREGLRHEGIYLSLSGERHRVDLAGLTGGKHVTVYGQTEVTKDLIAARQALGLPLLFSAEELRFRQIDGDKAKLTYTQGDELLEVEADFIAGCDGFHGPSREQIPAAARNVFERVYPFGWLGILVEAPPVADELIYAWHENGFSLCSMRSAQISRHYIQCAPDADPHDWPDQRVFEEIATRIGQARIAQGRVLEKSVVQMRSFVCEAMQHQRLFLVGDAAHIVPPTGAKGLNLAASDVHYLLEALGEYYKSGSEAGLENYTSRALARIWKAQRFSWWLTSLMHKFPNDPFYGRIQKAELAFLLSSRAAQQALAENYVGLPY